MPATAKTNFTSIQQWLAADPTKAAASLPEKDDGGKPATEGSRSSENCKDVGKLVPGNSVDHGKDNPKDEETIVEGSGLKQTTVGRMSEVEKAVKTVTDESEKVEKMSAELKTDAELDEALKTFAKLAGDLNQFVAQSTAQPAQPTKQAAAPQQPDPVAHFGPQAKEAADRAAAEVVAGYRQYGSDRGALTAKYLLGFEDGYSKVAQAEAQGAVGHKRADEQDGDGPPDAGPPQAAPAGPPDAGAMPPPGGDAGGGPGPDDMAGAMGELNLSPEELEQLIALLTQKLQAAQGAGGMAPADAKAAADELRYASKQASDARALMRSGKFRLKPAADGTPERKGRDAARAYIQELQRIAG